ncbi:3-hydroxyisobutyryl-coenzyme A hydrolase [Irpex lacteus]|nr:3-hydroxyisobutyryl-coenzyme A hydrolase [Irpex lacteus]
MLARSVRTMSNRSLAAQRTRAISRHMSSSTKASPDEAPVLFETVGQVKKYILNRPQKLNSLDPPMLNLLRPYVEEWSQSKISKILVGTGVGRAFCAGGDVACTSTNYAVNVPRKIHYRQYYSAVVQAAANDDTRHQALDFFKREFELDYLLAAVPQPYVAVMDGITMGGGVGLSINANFRIATEKTVFAMPETKIGYCPDVGASFFLSRVDGEVGTYLALTGETIKGRDVFELGFATHFVPSRRIPALLERLSSLDRPLNDLIDATIEEASQEREAHDLLARSQVQSVSRSTGLSEHEDTAIRSWAASTIEALELRSPTSLKVALEAIRRGKEMSLHEALQMELNIATAFCSKASPDFATGVSAVLVEKIKERPQWSPATLPEVKDDITLSDKLHLEPSKTGSPMLYTLPTEEEIRQLVTGSHPSSGSTSLTKDELTEKLVKLRRGKLGVREKVSEVVSRRCIEELDTASGTKYLRWKN